MNGDHFRRGADGEHEVSADEAQAVRSDIGAGSLTSRLTWYFALTLLLMLCGLAMIVRVAADRHFVELDHHLLRDKAHLVQEIWQRANDDDDLRQRLDEALHSHHGLYVWLREGEQWRYGEVSLRPPEDLVTLWRDEPAQRFAEFSLSDAEYRVLRSPLQGIAGASAAVWIAIDTRQHTHFSATLDRTLMLYVAFAALLAAVLSWWAAHSGLAPLRALRRRAETLTAKRLHERLPMAQMPKEMAILARSLNDMLRRLEDDFRRLSDFSSDLAHELRTPISNLLTQTQVALSHEREPMAYRDILASNAEEFQRLARMVEDMLFLAKTEHAWSLPRRESVQLEQEASALVEFYDAVAEERGIRVSLEGAAVVMGDRLMLRRAISNLLSNAFAHTPQGGVIAIRIHSEPVPSLSVENTGTSIDPAELPRLFDRFYRVDKARRHHADTGVGLGLAITRAIAQAHHGTVEVHSKDGCTRFTLRLSATSNAT